MAEIDIPTGPLDEEPLRAIWPVEGDTLASANTQALTEALAGVELGAWDAELLSALGTWPRSTVATICSWVHRVRAAAAPRDDEPKCRICGCTENEACPGGCAWVRDPEGGDLCSAHFITAETLGEQQIVRCVEWHDGDPVRILRVQLVAGPDGETFVRYQDVAAQHPAIGELVDRHHLVLPAGGGR
ncbi:hypothetical protein ACFYOK_37600 [Microbispora bryophytorum]|uniref:hypothetical protein n=1 Tax=Microbispora bryophytorum TaxID=1460882 RepID=UPI0034016318